MRSLFTEGEAAEALVEARDLAAFLDLAGPADPGGVDLGVDLEVERVAFLAPGRGRLELGAVGHFDGDHVIIGMSVGLHVGFPWVSSWFPTSRSKCRAPLAERTLRDKVSGAGQPLSPDYGAGVP